MFEYQKTIDHDNHLVRIRVTGEIGISDGKLIMVEARTEAIQQKYNLLYDLRAMTSRTNLHDLYRAVRELPVFREIQALHMRTAILHAPDDAGDRYKFYASTASNVGLSVRIFMDEVEALQWVTAEDET